MGYRRTNREKKLAPKKSKKHWCPCCDAGLVRPGGKCPTCKKRIGPRKFKKE